MTSMRLQRIAFTGICLRLAAERLQRRGHVAAKRPELRPVVLVRHGARPVLELELLERSERPISLFEELQPVPFRVIQIIEYVRLGLRFANERKSDGDDTRDRERRG